MSSTLLDVMPVLAALLAVPIYLTVQALALVKLRTGWRYAALLPLLLAITLAGSVVDSLTGGTGPTHRTLLLFSPGAIVYLAMLALLSALADKLAAAPPAAEESPALVAPPGNS